MAGNNWNSNQNKQTEEIIIEVPLWEAVYLNVKDTIWDIRLNIARWLYPDAFLKSKNDIHWF